MSIRDSILPKFDRARAKIAAVGLRSFSVTLRRRIWSGARVGEGTATNEDLVLTPAPKVRFKSPFGAQMSGVMASGGKIEDRYFQIDKITPAYDDGKGNVGGYTVQQLRMTVGSDVNNVDAVVVLVGSDGMAKECTQVIFEDDRNFGYSMTVQERDLPAVALASIAVLPVTAALAVGATQQMSVLGTFIDGSQWDVTALVKWSTSSIGVVTVTTLGVVRALSPGTVTVGASIGRRQAASATIAVA